jgi:hypothetical protein
MAANFQLASGSGCLLCISSAPRHFTCQRATMKSEPHGNWLSNAFAWRFGGLFDRTPHAWHTTHHAYCMLGYLGWDVAWHRWWRGLRPSQLLGGRKRRLLALACLRPHLPLLRDEERNWLDLVAAYAEGRISWWALYKCPSRAPTASPGTSAEFAARRAAYQSTSPLMTLELLSEILRHSIGATIEPFDLDTPERHQAHDAVLLSHCAFIRDMVGDPFDPAPQGWALRFRGSPRISSLATAVYREQAFQEMPALADALVAEGCSVPQVLQHCRAGTEHVRGCWVLDNLLGLPA